jgi:DNA processing protein
MGVDAISHKTALENNGGTIAVLGCGVDCCFPKENQGIYNSMIAGSPRANGDAGRGEAAGKGLVISEYPLSQFPTKGSFPSRNRIIAGLSLGVLVTEGAEDSGSLITAEYAMKFGRPVFAVPGPVTSGMSKGPFKLISRGAKLAASATDILKELNISPRSRIKNHELRIMKGDTEEEQKILDILQNEPLNFDEIVRRTKIDSSKTGSLLSIMEIKGMIKSFGSGEFSVAP